MKHSLIQALAKITEKIDEVCPLPKPPMTNEDFIPHGIPGRMIVSTLDFLDALKEVMADDPELVATLNHQSGYLRNADVPIGDRWKVAREVSDDLGEALFDRAPSWGPPRGIHPGKTLTPAETMPSDVFEEMSNSCREKRLMRPVPEQ